MIFLGCLFDREKEKYYLERSKIGLSNAANQFQWNLINGLNANLETPVTIVNALPVGIFPFQYNGFILPNRKWYYDYAENHEIGCINLPFIKQYQRYRYCCNLLKKSNDKNIIIYSVYLPFLKAAHKLDSSYHVTVIVTDLPEYYDLGKTSRIKKLFRRINNKKIYKCLERVDDFVLLTEQMKVPLKVGDRPYTIIEGICNVAPKEEQTLPQTTEKVILYTGTLHEQFGIGNLLEAFSRISAPDYRLWICGGGDMQEKVKLAAETDSRITFFGYVPKQKINELQAQATVLVNPRQNTNEFTKYSFPSKTMEYMLSGKPVLMYKLDGIPDEYDMFLLYINDNSVDSLKLALLEACEMPINERNAIAQKAVTFIMEEKNGSKQAQKLLKMLKYSDR